MDALDWLLGKPIATAAASRERVGPLRGVAILGLDALSSAAYGPEALLTVLLPLGQEGLRYVLPLTLCIVAVLLSLFFSYRQTIDAYPDGGGAYIVAKTNLGARASLVAAAALGVDYLLNAAVALSAGVGALVSAVPPLLPYTLPLCLFVLLGLTVLNLRGMRETGALLMLPTYAFVVALLTVIGLGLFRGATHAGAVVPPPTAAATATAAVTPWLLVRAFANGCTAMTGVEAVSNGVPIFRPPSSRSARHTLAIIVALLVVFLFGVAILTRVFHVTAAPPGQSGYQSILSQLAGAVLGRGLAYDLCMGAVFAVLTFSANTSFAAFPTLARQLAVDGYLPESFEHSGRRLMFSYGILSLAALAAALLVAFGGITDRLIPLFAMGALLAFTLSQAGMVMHWWRAGNRGLRLGVNAAGAVATGITTVLVLVSKFVEGAWLSALVVVVLVLLFSAVRRYHDQLERDTRTDACLDPQPPPAPLAVVPIRRWNTVAVHALEVALGISRDVVAVQVVTGDRPTDDLTARWEHLVAAPARLRGIEPPRLAVVSSEYRQVFSPILRFIAEQTCAHPGRRVAVVIPELVERGFYHSLMRARFASILRALLLLRGGPQVVVVTTPWYSRSWRSGHPESCPVEHREQREPHDPRDPHQPVRTPSHPGGLPIGSS